MMVHQGVNSFSKCSSRFFSEELMHSSSCIPECNSFYRIIGGGIMSFVIISLVLRDSQVIKNEIF